MKFIRRSNNLTDVSFTQALHSETQAPPRGRRELRVPRPLQQPLRVQRALQVRRVPGRLLRQLGDRLHLLLTD